ncbi:MAG: hypothetical protein KAR23_04305, partial [Candidatus Aenigmarchaeota archaeon]|nr:hypothetical protein [Candidatus Aenigmarchaeota archaeon]
SYNDTLTVYVESLTVDTLSWTPTDTNPVNHIDYSDNLQVFGHVTNDRTSLSDPAANVTVKIYDNDSIVYKGYSCYDVTNNTGDFICTISTITLPGGNYTICVDTTDAENTNLIDSDERICTPFKIYEPIQVTRISPPELAEVHRKKAACNDTDTIDLIVNVTYLYTNVSITDAIIYFNETYGICESETNNGDGTYTCTYNVTDTMPVGPLEWGIINATGGTADMENEKLLGNLTVKACSTITCGINPSPKTWDADTLENVTIYCDFDGDNNEKIQPSDTSAIVVTDRAGDVSSSSCEGTFDLAADFTFTGAIYEMNCTLNNSNLPADCMDLNISADATKQYYVNPTQSNTTGDIYCNPLLLQTPNVNNKSIEYIDIDHLTENFTLYLNVTDYDSASDIASVIENKQNLSGWSGFNAMSYYQTIDS